MAKDGRNGYGRVLLIIGGICMIVFFAVASYRTLSTMLRRFALDFFYPYLTMRRIASDRVSDTSLLLSSKGELASKVEALRSQNRVLAAQGAAASSLAQQNEELRRLLQLETLPQWRYRAAEIILRDPLNWTGQFTIDRGERHGVREGSAVFTVSTHGLPILVGVVRSAGGRTAQVVSSYSPSFRLSAALERSGAKGIVGLGGKSLPDGFQSVDYLPLGGNYAIDEALMTTGLESHVPPGLKIGNLLSLEQPESPFSNQMYVRGVLRPAADLDTIRFVMVATRL